MTNINYLYDPPAAAEFFGKNHFVDKTLGFKLIEHGTILPHTKTADYNWWGICGVVDRQGHLHADNSSMQVRGGLYAPTDVATSSATAIYLGLFGPAWGHNITINLCRLWFLHGAAFKRYFKNCRLVYVPWQKTWGGGGRHYIAQKKNFGRLLELADINPNDLQPIEQPTRFDNVIMPDSSFFRLEDDEFYFTEDYRATVNRIRDFALRNRTPTSADKVYYFYGRHENGEKHLAEYFKSKGYSVVKPERLPLEEQLNLMINCKSFAATLGSCAHNSVFLRDGTEAIFIPRAANMFMKTKYQHVINQVRDLRANYIDSSLSLFGQLHQDYCFIVSRQLKEFFGDKFYKYYTPARKILRAYVEDSLRRGIVTDATTAEYYREPLREFLPQLGRHPYLAAFLGRNDIFFKENFL